MVPRRLAAIFAGCASVSCAPAAHTLLTAAAPPAALRTSSADATRPDVRLSLRAPSSVDVAETALGLDETPLALAVTNASPGPLALGDVQVVFHARLGRVELPCERTRSDHLTDDAGTLAPGASFVVRRSLGCWTPMSGDYDLRADVTFSGADGPRIPAPIGASLRLHVTDAHQRGAREFPSRPGLFVAAGGDTRTLPVIDGRREDDGYQVAIVLVNAGDIELAPATVHASLRVYAAGSSLACAGDQFDRGVRPLPVGEVQVLRVPATCIRDMPGRYDVVVHLAFVGDDGPGIDVGHVGVEVTWSRNVEPL